MELLYQTHFGLSQAPFNITPDPTFLFLSASHREGLAQLSYGIKARKGFVVLTGEVGTGKTTLIHALLNELNGTCQTALIFNAITNSVDLLRCICEEFRLVEPTAARKDSHDYLVLLNEFLLGLYRKGENCALIIDEAQTLSAEVLESVRLLSNFETSKDKLLQILLVGQPELAVRLSSPDLRQLKQRVTLRHHLRTLTMDECRDYIENRLQVAGGNGSIFNPKAIEHIHIYSGGVPRLVNVLCDNAMLTGYALGKKEIDAGIIREVADDLGLTCGLKPVIPLPERTVNGVGSISTDVTKGARVQPATYRPSPRLSVVNDLSSAPTSMAVVNDRFFDAMGLALTEAMGPMARVVMRDQIRLLGESAGKFPTGKLGTLLDSVSREILDDAMKAQFRQVMSEKIRALKLS